MPIQTAPDTITLTHADNSVSTLELYEVSDDTIQYRFSLVAGTTPPLARDVPRLIVTRRPQTAKNSSTKFVSRLMHDTFDLLGKRVGSFLSARDSVAPAVVYSDTITPKVLEEAHNLFMSSDFYLGMVEDGSFAR